MAAEDLFAESIAANKQLKETVLTTKTAWDKTVGDLNKLATDGVNKVRTEGEAAVKAAKDAQAGILASAKQYSDLLPNFALTDTLLSLRDPYVTVPARFATIAEAEAFEWGAAIDYNPQVDVNGTLTNCYKDFATGVPSATGNYTLPKQTQFTKRVSIYAAISVGSNPHPRLYGNSASLARIAVLHSSHGASQYLMLSAPPDYSKPRTPRPELKNYLLDGQSHGITMYDELIPLAENIVDPFSWGLSFLRIINLGPLPIHIKGLWILHHGSAVKG